MLVFIRVMIQIQGIFKWLHQLPLHKEVTIIIIIITLIASAKEIIFTDVTSGLAKEVILM